MYIAEHTNEKAKRKTNQKTLNCIFWQ